MKIHQTSLKALKLNLMFIDLRAFLIKIKEKFPKHKSSCQKNIFRGEKEKLVSVSKQNSTITTNFDLILTQNSR